jgi:hypothetical protein
MTSEKEQAAEQRIEERVRIAEIILREFLPKGNALAVDVIKVTTRAAICARKIMGDWEGK